MSCVSRLALVLVVFANICTLAKADEVSTPRFENLRQKLENPQAGVVVVAHRGCHNAAPAAHLASAPENSIAALDHCVALGVDMMELDVRRTKDGALVIMHDATVDRTTNGSGLLAEMTLAEVAQLKLRDNFGGNMAPTLTEQKVPTLQEILGYARGRILLNLDVKEEIYPEVVAMAISQGMGPYVIVKRVIEDDIAPVSDQVPYNSIPFMPIVGHWPARPPQIPVASIAARQVLGSHRPVGVEMVYLSQSEFHDVAKIAKDAHIRLFANTLSSVGVLSVIDMGGDTDALRDQGNTWDDLIKSGVSMIQTDEPGPLLSLLKSETISH